MSPNQRASSPSPWRSASTAPLEMFHPSMPCGGGRNGLVSAVVLARVFYAPEDGNAFFFFFFLRFFPSRMLQAINQGSRKTFFDVYEVGLE